MFEMSLVESSGRLKSKSSRYVWITGMFNAAIVGTMVLVPLLYPEALPRTSWTAMLTAPPPPAAAPPPPRPQAIARAVKGSAPLDVFTAPTRIPRTIDTARDEAPPQALGAGVVSMVGLGSNSAGPADAMGIGAPMAVVEVVRPKATAPAHVSSGVIAGNKLSGASPVYPAIAKAAHVSGAVVLHAVLSKTGTIRSLSVVSGPEMLRGSALSAVQGWMYRPYLLNGEATDVETTITVNFSFGG